MRKIVERPMKYKIGDKLGDLTIIDKISNKEKYSKTKFLVKCKCGKEFELLPYTLNSRKYFMCKECYIKSNIGTGKWAHGKKINDYQIERDTVRINQNILIDLDDLEKIKSINRYWSINIGGYAYCKVKNEQIFLHRMILDLSIRYDKNTNLIVDHINGDRLDNRKQNLRIINKKENSINCRLYSTNTSGAKGVCWNKKLNKWEVSIQVNKKSIYLGVYKDKDEAIKVRKEAEEKYFGELNRKEY